MTTEGNFKGVQEKQTRRINTFLYKEALSEMLCLFNSNFVCSVAGGGMPAARGTVLGCSWRKHRPHTQTCSSVLVQTLADTYVLCFSSVLPSCKHRNVSCPVTESCICPSSPSSTASFFVTNFWLLFSLKAKHLGLRFWMVTCLATIVAEGLFPLYLVTFLPNGTWESFKNTGCYCLL